MSIIERDDVDVRVFRHYPTSTIGFVPKGISRRNFLQLSAAVGVAIMVPACGIESGPSTEIYMSNAFRDQLNEGGVEIVTRSFNKYVKMYGCPLSQVSFDVVDLSSETETTTDGGSLKTIEVSGSGYIHYDLGAIQREKTTSEVRRSLINTTIHAMTHACQLEPAYLAETITLNDGSVVYGFQGMSLLVARPDGSSTAFRAIEEGVAEALAVKLDPGYSTTDFGYFQIGSLTLNTMNTWSSPENVAKMSQTNDVWGFVSVMTGKSTPEVQDLERVMSWYQHARNGSDLESILSEVSTSWGR